MNRTPLINFNDAVTASNLNPDQLYAVYYADGAFANRAAVAARCSHAKLFAITVFGETGQGIFACDSETGDLDIPQTVAWVAEQVRLGVPLICVYANYDRWVNQGLLTSLSRYGSRIKRWVADFDNVPTIPAWADAKQFANPGPVDENVALANFFGDAAPAPDPVQPLHYDWFYPGPFPSKWGPLNERLVVEQYDGARKHVLYALYVKFVLRPKLRFLAQRVAAEAGAGKPNPTWGEFRRGWRFQALQARAEGKRLV